MYPYQKHMHKKLNENLYKDDNEDISKNTMMKTRLIHERDKENQKQTWKRNDSLYSKMRMRIYQKARWKENGKKTYAEKTTFMQRYKDEDTPNMKRTEIYARINKYYKWNMKKINVEGWERSL